MPSSAADRIFRLPRWAALTLLLCACAASPPRTEQESVSAPSIRPENFALEGRFSFRHEERNYYGRLDWRHAGELDSLLLSSSFGQGMAEMTADGNGARLVLGNGEIHEASRVETLTRRLFGYPLSLKQLAGWVAGRVEQGGADADADSLGRLHRLRHENWIVDYVYENGEAHALPARITAVHAEGNAELRLKIDKWRIVTRPAVNGSTIP
ncbi:MAG: outer membrane lipoprotein LolB [Candidatus Accumulibacter sp.]|jgi:outer membrane lipoprotein LolB|nr:outer membrane lipoprotein LolB [Accumulibacter sp.]